MIIKSMSRKSPSFGQLGEYMENTNEDERYNLYNHLYTQILKDTVESFEENARLLPKRKNGVYLYHEVISLTRNEQLNQTELKEKLRQIANSYIQTRAKNHLVYGVIHNDHKDHIHYHLMISSNEKGSERRRRLTKKQFDDIKKQLEKHVLEYYPELNQQIAINKKSERKLGKKGEELRKRTGKTPKKDELRETLSRMLKQSKNHEEFLQQLKAKNLSFYRRGKTVGIIEEETGRKHRFKTLGLETEYGQLIQTNESKKQEKAEEQQAKSETHEQKREYRQEEQSQRKEEQTQERTRKEDQPKQEQANMKKESEQKRKPPQTDDELADRIDEIFGNDREKEKTESRENTQNAQSDLDKKQEKLDELRKLREKKNSKSKGKTR